MTDLSLPASPIDAPPHTTTLDEPTVPEREPVRLGALLPGVLAQIRKNQETPR